MQDDAEQGDQQPAVEGEGADDLLAEPLDELAGLDQEGVEVGLANRLARWRDRLAHQAHQPGRIRPRVESRGPWAHPGHPRQLIGACGVEAAKSRNVHRVGRGVAQGLRQSQGRPAQAARGPIAAKRENRPTSASFQLEIGGRGHALVRARIITQTLELSLGSTS